MAKAVKKSTAQTAKAQPYPKSQAQGKRKHHSIEAIRAKRLKTINPPPKVPSTVLDLFVWGSGSMCELGLGPEAKTKEVKRPRLNPLINNIVDFAVGGMHVLALDKDNQLWSWGNNDSGVLGRNTEGADKLKDMDGNNDDDDDDGDLNELESTPAKVEFKFPAGIVQLAAADNISLVLLANGEVWAWGTFRNNEGLLGFSRDIKIQKTPLRIDVLEDIVQLIAGKDHVLALDSKGLVYTWGNGQQGQLGRRIVGRDALQVLEPRSLGIKHVKTIGTGECHSFAITLDNRVFVWGLNQYGQCGLPGVEDGAIVEIPTELTSLNEKNIIQITGGEHHSLALSSNGEIYSFGRYDMKEIGVPKDQLPIDDCIVDAHGNVRCMPTPFQLKGLPLCKTVACGSHHSLAVSKSGIAFSWGFADTYAVGLGNLDDDVEKPTVINNTATRDHDIHIVGAGGQFSVSGGVKLSEEEVEKRLDEFEDYL